MAMTTDISLFKDEHFHSSLCGIVYVGNWAPHRFVEPSSDFEHKFYCRYMTIYRPPANLERRENPSCRIEQILILTAVHMRSILAYMRHYTYITGDTAVSQAGSKKLY